MKDSVTAIPNVNKDKSATTVDAPTNVPLFFALQELFASMVHAFGQVNANKTTNAVLIKDV